ncbi:hypothetical protein [Leptospira interrogans]|uniref:hypothetical protein n=1 Tax=Leptospira interrogans TaxID=173 RepID=UPI00029762EA|nr:hypothetical protein [Leptospira interrogans]EKR17354.1 hypothetical protein LEP1GSC019_0083 [Leptospira interrogans serovar Pyrogenes str. 2006006960]
MSWVLQSDGTYLSNSSSFKGYLEGGIWKLVNLNVDDGRFLSYEELLNFPPVPAGGTLPNPYNNNIILGSGFFINSETYLNGFTTIQNGDIDLGVGNVLYSAGTPVAGFLDDGTPFFKRRINFTLGPSASNIVVPHGIPNAFTNSRILGYEYACISTNLPTSYQLLASVSTTAISPASVRVNDTNLTFFVNIPDSNTRNFTITLIYI